MAIPTLVIGLGGTGVLTLRALKHLYGELLDDEKVPISLLAFDFDRSALVAGDNKARFAALEDQEFFYLNPKGIQDMLRNLDRADNGGLAWEKILQWFPERSHVQIPVSEVESNGASQLRVLGRLGFFLNDEVIESTVRRKLNELGSEVDRNSLSDEKRVILVSSVAGGTGAGMLVDMAYIVRRQDLRPRVFTYLLLPEVFEDVDSGRRIFQNSYACLKELAHLKEQLIPFQASYYRIPPLDIPVSGEEPFARIFLARGDGFAGSDAIRAATVQMAGTILPQLQRVIQEKTLAVVSNTLSASEVGEQRRKRTHGFSTATSVSLPLRPVAPTADVLYQIFVSRLSDPAFLEAAMARDLRIVFRLFEERLEQGGKTGPPEAYEGEASRDGQVTDAQVRDLLLKWRSQIERSAKAGCEEILKELSDHIGKAHGLARTGRPENAADALTSLRDTEELVLASRSEEAYEGNLAYLKKLTAFNAFDKLIREQAATYLKTVDATLGTEANLKRKVFYTKLGAFDPLLWINFPPIRKEGSQERRKKLEEARAKLERVKKASWWRKIFWPTVHSSAEVLATCDELKDALADTDWQSYLIAILAVRGLKTVKEEIQRNLESAQKNLKDVEAVWKNLPPATSFQIAESTERQQQILLGKLGSRLGTLLDQAVVEVRGEEDPQVRGRKLLALLRRKVREDPSLPSQQYELVGESEEIEDWLREQLVRSRQKVFERRTPNPQRKGFTLIMVPQGILWPSGKQEDFRLFLEASAAQILASRVQVEDYEGSRLWIYSEDLFNPPEHIRNLDEYFRTYDQQKFKELFHIDRRMLANPLFRDINSSTSSIVVHCGNPDCLENIGGVSRKETVCPFCSGPIRTRCGNPGCSANDLDRNAKGTDPLCPTCGGYNHAAWWRCCKHGKVDVDVPIDKERCPRCIEEHQKNPFDWPRSKISKRPDLVDCVVCPHCRDQEPKDPSYESYKLPKKLVPFYKNGVNGHDKKPFLELADHLGLPEKVRCPKCRTLLIPFHHERVYKECPRRPK